MKLKTATLLAIIGTFVMVCLSFYSFYSYVLTGDLYSFWDDLLRYWDYSLEFFAFSLLLVFFITLYMNQVNQKSRFMKLKTATLLAIIGVSSIICMNLYNVFDKLRFGFGHIGYYLFEFIAFCLFFIFFITLFRKQQKQKAGDMNLTKALKLAIVGAILLICRICYGTVKGIFVRMEIGLSLGTHLVKMSLLIASFCTLLLFFIILYRNQTTK